MTMFIKIHSNTETSFAKANEGAKETPAMSRGYQAPELHDVGTAVELVQVGGGSYADNNRARQY
jgi:hypothetical protein